MGLSPRHPDNPKPRKPNLFTIQICYGQGEKSSISSQSTLLPPLHIQKAVTWLVHRKRIQVVITAFVSWVFRRGTVSSTGHRNLECLQRGGIPRRSLGNSPRALPAQNRSQTLLHLPSRLLGTSGTSCLPALATKILQETQACPFCLQLSMPHLKTWV